MYIASQKVQSNRGNVAINSYLYLHGSYHWNGWPPFTPESNPGVLTAQRIHIMPPNNTILSFLDVIMPDDMTPGVVWSAYEALKNRLWNQVFPDGAFCYGVWFRFNIAPHLYYRINDELEQLFKQAHDFHHYYAEEMKLSGWRLNPNEGKVFGT